MRLFRSARLLSLIVLALFASHAHSALIITGVADGPNTGGTPKALELYVNADIPDLSIYSIANFNNGSTTATTTFAFPAVPATAGSFIYVGSESTQFTAFFGFAPTFTSGAVNVNGDDAIRLFQNSLEYDVVGVVGVDGTGQFWDYLDGWIYRNDGTSPSTTFIQADWTYSGIDQLEPAGTNAGTTQPFPIGTYTPAAIPEPGTIALGALAGLGFLGYRLRRKQS